METDIVANAGVRYIPMSDRSYLRMRAKKGTTTTTSLILFNKKT